MASAQHEPGPRTLLSTENFHEACVCIARGIFTSTADLRRKLMQYIRAHNKTCHPFVWSYSDPTRRIRVDAN